MISKRSLAVALSSLMVVLAAPATLAQEETDIVLMPVDVEVYDVSAVAPADWPHIGLGRYARGTPPTDWTLLALQDIDGTPDDVVSLLQTQLAIPDALEQTGEASTALSDWSLYRFETNLPDPISGELAMSSHDGGTYIVLQLAEPDEFEAFRESVFVPAIEAFAPLETVVVDPETLDYDVEEVAFASGAPDVDLAGTLTRPRGPGPHPVVLLISGSGGQDRDETLKPAAALKPFQLIADALTSAGVAVLRYDDRGVAGSTGDRAGLTLDGITADAAGAVDFLASRDDIDPDRIGLLGHSEGGLVSARLGASDERIAFIVDMAGPAVPGQDVLREQTLAILHAGGMSEDALSAYGSFLDSFYPLVLTGDESAANELATSFFDGFYDLLPQVSRDILDDREATVQRQSDALVDIMVSNPDTAPWYRVFFEYDPATDWRQVTVPVLGVFGGKDLQVLADQNAPALEEALMAAGNDDVEIVVLPDANHLFQSAVTGAPSEYGTLDAAFDPAFLPTVVDWVTVRAGVAE